MKTLFYIILLLIVIAGFAAGIYYLTTVDFSGVTDKVSSAVDNITSYVDSLG